MKEKQQINFYRNEKVQFPHYPKLNFQIPKPKKKSKKNYQITSMVINPRKEGFGIKNNYSFTYIPRKEIKILSLKNYYNEKKNIKPVSIQKMPEDFSKKFEKKNTNISLVKEKKHDLSSVTKPKMTKFQIELYEDLSTKPKDPQDLFCKCKNTNCLKLFCGCFKTLGYCGPQCKCLNCLNTKDYDKERDFVIKSTKHMFKHAFKDKKNYMRDYKGVLINCLGCICQKGCGGNYCACRKNSGKCSTLCICKECENNRIDIDRDTVIKIMSEFKSSRRKHKVVIDFDNKRIEYRKARKGPNKN